MSAQVSKFLSAYEERLLALRTASKPQISSLTMIADENRSVAPEIASLIANHIQHIPPENRLPLIYLMDSIIKNIGGEFTQCFAQHATRIVLSTFRQAGPTLRKSLSRLVATWKNHRLFAPGMIYEMLQEMESPPGPIMRDRKRSRDDRLEPYPTARRGGADPYAHPALVQRQREELWHRLEMEIRQYPHLRSQFEHIRTLRRRGQDVTDAIDSLTDSMRRGCFPPAPPSPYERRMHPALRQQQQQQPSHPPRPHSMPLQPYPVNVAPPAPTNLRSSESLELIKTLDQLSGLLDQSKPVPSVAPEPELSSAALKRSDASAVAALYEKFDSQCEYCGLRMATKDAMAEHLDWHFQVNRDQKKREKQSASQLWFMEEDEWVRCSGTDEREAAPSYFDLTLAANKDEEEKKEKLVVATVPADNSQTSCHSCGETFVRFWDDSSEQWLYRDAIYLQVGADKKIVHASCHEPVEQTPISS